MNSGGDFEGLVLKGITPVDGDRELGRGAYGRVYAVNYYGTTCAAKEIHSILVEGVGQVQTQQTVGSFMRECRQCSSLRHPNIIQFLGVYYPNEGAGGVQRRIQLPVMVMEMMTESLTSLVDKHEKIPVHIKFSIVHDVSLGLRYLHNHDPPIVHRDLSPNNILLTAHHVAKISDLGVAKVIRTGTNRTLTKAPGTIDFMPPESLSDNPVYGPSLDVFSFGGIVLHTFNQQWPRPSEQVRFDPKTRRKEALMEVERRQQYLDKLKGEEAEVLRPLVMECLDDDPAVRPNMAAVYDRIKASKDAYMNIDESSQNIITLYQENIQMKSEVELTRSENDELKSENHQLNAELSHLRQQLETSRICVTSEHVDSQPNRDNVGRGRSEPRHYKSVMQHFAQWIKEGKFSLLAMMLGVLLAYLMCSLWIENNNLTAKNKLLIDELFSMKGENQNVTELNQQLLDWVEHYKISHDIIVTQVYYIKKWMDAISKLQEHKQHVIQYCKLKKKFNEFFASPEEVYKLHRLRQLIKYDLDEDNDEIVVHLVERLIMRFNVEYDKCLNALLFMNFEEMKQLQDGTSTKKIENMMDDFLKKVATMQSQRSTNTAIQHTSLVSFIGTVAYRLATWMGHWLFSKLNT